MHECLDSAKVELNSRISIFGTSRSLNLICDLRTRLNALILKRLRFPTHRMTTVRQKTCMPWTKSVEKRFICHKIKIVFICIIGGKRDAGDHFTSFRSGRGELWV